MNKYTIQFNIVAKGVNKMDDKFTHNFFNWFDNWGEWYYDELENGIGVDEKTIDAWEAVEIKVIRHGLLSIFNTGMGMEELTPLWKITNIDTSIYGDLWEAIVEEIANNSSWYFMNITGYNMTIDLIEDGKGLKERFELGEYIQNKALEGRY